MNTALPTTTRIDVLDVLRGFAIVSIMLLHNIEHFDVYYLPENLPLWMKSLDKIIWDSLFFLFGGKSYSIFSLLFGVTYAIQLGRQKEKGNSFDGIFAWRMILLFGFGIFNSAFYQGDVLEIYAVLGLFLIPLCKLSEKAIFGIAVFLLLLPYEWVNVLYAIQNPNESVSNPESWSYFDKMITYVGESSFWNTIMGNLTNGKMGVMLWNWEKGRFFTILGLFLLGYLMGKRRLFEWNPQSEQFWKKAFTIAVIAFIPLYFIQKQLKPWIANASIRRPIITIETSWTNLAFMMILVSGILLLFYKTNLGNKLMYFSSFGRMSMSNYIIQSIIGTAIYYSWGLGLYQYTGATYSVLIALALTIIMGVFCKWWAKNHKQGPFETLWHKATWLGKKS